MFKNLYCAVFMILMLTSFNALNIKSNKPIAAESKEGELSFSQIMASLPDDHEGPHENEDENDEEDHEGEEDDEGEGEEDEDDEEEHDEEEHDDEEHDDEERNNRTSNRSHHEHRHHGRRFHPRPHWQNATDFVNAVNRGMDHVNASAHAFMQNATEALRNDNMTIKDFKQTAHHIMMHFRDISHVAMRIDHDFHRFHHHYNLTEEQHHQLSDRFDALREMGHNIMKTVMTRMHEIAQHLIKQHHGGRPSRNGMRPHPHNDNQTHPHNHNQTHHEPHPEPQPHHRPHFNHTRPQNQTRHLRQH